MRSRFCIGMLWSLLVVAMAATVHPDGVLGRQDPKPVLQVPDGEVLRRAQELSRPTVEHERLAKLAGKWQVTLRTRLPDGGKPVASKPEASKPEASKPEASKPASGLATASMQEDRGTVVGSSMLGGRYVVLNYQLKVQGRAIEAVQILGFDTLQQAFTSTWRDNATTWSVDCLGGVSKDADVLTLTGQLRDAESPDGRGFRLTLDLRKLDQVTVQVHEERGMEEVLLQEQIWQR